MINPNCPECEKLNKMCPKCELFLLEGSFRLDFDNYQIAVRSFYPELQSTETRNKVVAKQLTAEAAIADYVNTINEIVFKEQK